MKNIGDTKSFSSLNLKTRINIPKISYFVNLFFNDGSGLSYQQIFISFTAVTRFSLYCQKQLFLKALADKKKTTVLMTFNFTYFSSCFVNRSSDECNMVTVNDKKC